MEEKLGHQKYKKNKPKYLKQMEHVKNRDSNVAGYFGVFCGDLEEVRGHTQDFKYSFKRRKKQRSRSSHTHFSLLYMVLL